MNIFHVTSPGAKVSRNNGNLLISQEGSAPKVLPVATLKALFLYPGVSITDPAERLLLSWGVIILRLDKKGRLKGVTFSPDYFPDYALLRKQLELEDNENQRIELAKAIVLGKLKSLSAYLQGRYKISSKKGEGHVYFLKAAQEIERLTVKLKGAGSLWQIRGIEGRAGKVYFGAIAKFLSDKGFAFYGRRYRPNPDLVNAALSYGYAVLRGYVYVAIVAAKLMPYPGILHEDHIHNKLALVYDLMEEFRVVFVDSTVIKLLLNKQLNNKHINREGREVFLNDLGRKTLINALVKRTLTKFRHPETGEVAELREIIAGQALRLASAIKHEKPYKPFYLLS